MECKPIETAPKDGRKFLAFWPDPFPIFTEISSTDKSFWCTTWWDKDGWANPWYDADKLEFPTHWIPHPFKAS